MRWFRALGAVLSFMLVAFTASCAAIWGFQDLEVADDASTAHADGSTGDGSLLHQNADARPDSVSPEHDAVALDVTVPLDTGIADAATDHAMGPSDAGEDACLVCGTQCVDSTTDVANCGSCGHACATGDSCQDGVCKCPGSEMTCPGSTAGTTVCVDTRSDHGNCGGCGNACPTGATCQSGTCVCPGSEALCAGQCLDLTSDVNNCGGCGKACPASATCQSSVCVCPGSGEANCGGTCTNELYDPFNCGACGTACATGVTCQPPGTCTCVGATSMCPVNNVMTCVNTASDPNNCGMCGKTCPGGASCSGGSCICAAKGTDTVTMCAAGGTCIDLTIDANNCGRCGQVCPTGTHCSGGGCVCTGTLALCGTTCVDTTTDNANCGACGHACPSGSACQGSTCVCASPLTMCSGACVDENNDVANCGACGKKCSGGNAAWRCSQSGTTGACAISSCNAGFADCDGNPANGCEAALASDATNCGGCGRQCPLTASCTTGACACLTAGQSFCPTTATTGICTNLQTDDNNCGTCATKCTGTQQCSTGTCSCNASSCPTGCCDGATCEPFSSQSMGMCGAGGAACVMCPVGSEICAAAPTANGGLCRCAPGMTLCGSLCADLTMDPANCGMCGMACASGVCQGSVCAADDDAGASDATLE